MTELDFEAFTKTKSRFHDFVFPYSLELPCVNARTGSAFAPARDRHLGLSDCCCYRED